ncbi:hypothetical protein ACHAXT_008514 [Thalassiosira profunda]
MASAAVAIVGCHRERDTWRCNSLGTRCYHGTAARCESERPEPSKEDGSGANSKEDSFFDMAQQWFGEKKETAATGNNAGRSNDVPTKSPEGLLESMGILGGSAAQSHDEDSGSSKGERESVDAEEPSDLKSMLQKVRMRFDELQSSSPKSPSAEEGARDAKHSTPDEDEGAEDSSSSIFSDFISFANNASLFTKKSLSSPPVEELIQQAQSIANSSSSNTSSQYSSVSSAGFLSQVLFFQQNAKAIQKSFETSFGPHLDDIDIDIFNTMPLVAARYFLEEQDSIKTPSWKRRLHRFQRDVEVSKVEELNEALILSELSYSDNVDQIREGLENMYDGKNNKPQWELLFCDLESEPNQPSHFLAIQKNASPYDDALRVLMVVRGTKSMSDLITDAMLDGTDYAYALPGGGGEEELVIGGKAHSGVLRSGQYLVERHQKLLQTLLQLSNKRKVEMTLIGHSLGAGAATIAAMEWNSAARNNKEADLPISAHVIGFGCPALLSRPLSLATKDYVTTVIADADFIPRMSGATLVNLLLDLKSFDYQRQAERDVEHALREMKSRFSGLADLVPGAKGKNQFALNIDEEDIQSVMGYVHHGLEKVTGASVDKSSEEQANARQTEQGRERYASEKKMEPVLFPPGKCVHFWRDGSGISGTYVPCTFFNEIDVSRTMIEDHLISSGYRRVFLNLMRDYHKDDHFSFEGKVQE